MDLPGPLLVVPPSRRPHTHTVVFLHGRGDTARSLAETLHHFTDGRSRSLFELFPSFRWVFPQAPLRDVARTGDKTYQWFDVWDMSDPEEREGVQRGGVAESVGRVGRLVRDEAGVLGTWEGVVVAGISQGGATGLQALANLDGRAEGGVQRIGAVIGFSCRLPFLRDTLAETRAEVGVWKRGEGRGQGKSESEGDGEGQEGEEAQDDPDQILRNTPILLEHCADDALVPIRAGRDARDALLRWGASVTWKEYPDGGHWFNCPAGADDVAEFLRGVFRLGRDGVPLGG